jgi:hypothetical protein
MKSAFAVVFLLVSLVPTTSAEQASPIEKIIEMISDLQAKVLGEGTDAQKTYDEYQNGAKTGPLSWGLRSRQGRPEWQS